MYPDISVTKRKQQQGRWLFQRFEGREDLLLFNFKALCLRFAALPLFKHRFHSRLLSGSD